MPIVFSVAGEEITKESAMERFGTDKCFYGMIKNSDRMFPGVSGIMFVVNNGENCKKIVVYTDDGKSHEFNNGLPGMVQNSEFKAKYGAKRA